MSAHSSPTFVKKCRIASALILTICAFLFQQTLAFAYPAPSWHSHTYVLHSDNSDADPALVQTVNHNEKYDFTSHVVVDAGHVDIGPRFVKGKWGLYARDDSHFPPTWRPLDHMVFYLSDKAIQQLPQGNTYDFTGAHAGEKIYAVPQTEIEHVPWLGWSTQEPDVVHRVDGQVTLTFEGHEGPGQFTNFLQEGLGGSAKPLWISSKKTAQPIHVDTNTHTHTNWIFTQPGVHLVRITASARLKDGKTVTDSQVLRFAVGDKNLIKKAQEKKWSRNTPQKDVLARNALSSSSSDTSKESHSTFLWWGGAIVCVVVILLLAIFFTLSHRRCRKAQNDALTEED